MFFSHPHDNDGTLQKDAVRWKINTNMHSLGSDGNQGLWGWEKSFKKRHQLLELCFKMLITWLNYSRTWPYNHVCLKTTYVERPPLQTPKAHFSLYCTFVKRPHFYQSSEQSFKPGFPVCLLISTDVLICNLKIHVTHFSYLPFEETLQCTCCNHMIWRWYESMELSCQWHETFIDRHGFELYCCVWCYQSWNVGITYEATQVTTIGCHNAYWNPGK